MNKVFWYCSFWNVRLFQILRINNSRAKYPNDDPVASEGSHHQHGVDESQAVVPILANSWKVPPVLVHHILVLFRDVPTEHVIYHLFRYPGEFKNIRIPIVLSLDLFPWNCDKYFQTCDRNDPGILIFMKNH